MSQSYPEMSLRFLCQRTPIVQHVPPPRTRETLAAWWVELVSGAIFYFLGLPLSDWFKTPTLSVNTVPGLVCPSPRALRELNVVEMYKLWKRGGG